MATPVPLLGVTVEIVAAEIGNFTASASSSPTAATITTMIARQAALIYGEADAMGIDLADLSVEDSTLYRHMQEMIIAKTTAKVVTARDRGNPDAGKAFLADYEDLRATLRTFPQKVVTNDEGVGSASNISQIQTFRDQIRVPYTMQGKIITGGPVIVVTWATGTIADRMGRVRDALGRFARFSPDDIATRSIVEVALLGNFQDAWFSGGNTIGQSWEPYDLVESGALRESMTNPDYLQFEILPNGEIVFGSVLPYAGFVRYMWGEYLILSPETIREIRVGLQREALEIVRRELSS